MDLINNFRELATNKLRGDFLEVLEQGILGIHPKVILKNKINLEDDILKIEDKSFDLKNFKNIYVVGIGKTSGASCRILEEIIGDRISAGYCIDTHLERNLKTIVQIIGTHPYISKKNFSFSKAVVSTLEKTDKNDLVITVISGGGSALFCYPYETECVVGEKLFENLTRNGAHISEINIIRKHLSSVKGGGLAKIIYPATLISFIFSDVPGNDLSLIASGPTVKDSSTTDDAKNILRKYNIDSENINWIETPKDAKYFQDISNFLVCRNIDALNLMRDFLLKKGYKARLYKDDFQMEARSAGKFLLGQTQGDEVLLTGGETFVKIKGSGKGGRNLEVTLGALENLKKDEFIISFASDGIDNTDSAGAIGDIETLEKSKKLGLSISNYLDNNDSYNFFEKTKNLIFTGPIEVNVSDIILTYKK